MIYSQATCLTTGQRMWIGRKTDLGPQFGYGDQPTQIESAWIAGVHAETYAKEALNKIPSFEWTWKHYSVSPSLFWEQI